MKMKLPAVVNKHKVIIGGVVAAGIAYALYQKLKGRPGLYSPAPIPGMMSDPFTNPTAKDTYFSGLGRVDIANPGIADDQLQDNQVNWVAAGPDPSAYSKLTLRNEEKLYSHLPHEVFAGAPSKNFEAMKFSGSFGLTGPPGQGFFTYF
jgi:hypothetical protein